MPFSLVWFKNQVGNGKAWDYKAHGGDENYGNFSYGATGRALGVGLNFLLRMAGENQYQKKIYDPKNGKPWGDAPFGDTPHEQALIRLGAMYYDNGCRL
jgi:hypothetical protein